ncbi:MAG: hypothetical protein ACRYG7_46230 [Janthinobacterium lividum]
MPCPTCSAPTPAALLALAQRLSRAGQQELLLALHDHFYHPQYAPPAPAPHPGDLLAPPPK